MISIRHEIKKFIKKDFVIKFLATLIAIMLRGLFWTLRTTTIGKENIVKNSGCAIICFWHGRLAMMPFIISGLSRINLLASGHSDGKLIAEVQRIYGMKIIIGSSSKGGFLALREFFRVKKRGELIAITPDGPRGPARKVGGLIIEIAKKLDIPIIPVTFSCSNYKTVQSWDSLMIPKPFSKGIYIIGKPMKYESPEELEIALNNLTDEADAAFKTI